MKIPRMAKGSLDMDMVDCQIPAGRVSRFRAAEARRFNHTYSKFSSIGYCSFKVACITTHSGTPFGTRKNNAT